MGDEDRESSDGKISKQCRALACHVPAIILLFLAAMNLRDQVSFGERYGETTVTMGSEDFEDVAEEVVAESDDNETDGKNDKIKPDGFMVLGMHRSGTSMLTGLLNLAAGYAVGGYKHHGLDNVKGYFEHLEIQHQNDKWMRQQGIAWNTNVLDFDSEQALRDRESGAVEFDKGENALKFYRNPENTPWVQKEPRMCVTLPAWLELLDKPPAIVFTYRHPLEVAMSLYKRGKKIHLTRGLHMWIAYNMLALQNSRGLCIVRTKNIDVLADALTEIQRISDELTDKCGVPAPAHRVLKEEVDKFIDPDLQHYHATENKDKEVVAEFNGGTCFAYEYKSQRKRGTLKFNEEREMYLKAMTMYCDLESGKAYEDDYVWPEIESVQE